MRKENFVLNFVADLSRRIDHKVKYFIDRLLPWDLRTKYIVALSITAIALLFGQILVQSSLEIQLEDVQKIRATDRFSIWIEKLEASNSRILLSSEANSLDREVKILKNSFTKMRQIIEFLNESEKTSWFSTQRDEITSIHLDRIRKSSNNIEKIINSIEEIVILKRVDVQERLIKIQPLLKPLNLEVHNFKILATHLNNSLDKSLTERMNQLQKREFYIVLIIFLVLIMQGMYIFRPSILRLYRALEARSDLLSRVGHEIRNPLNAIMGVSRIVEQKSSSPEIKYLMKRQNAASQNLLAILNNLLKAAENERNETIAETTRITLHQLVDDLVEMYSPLAKQKGLEFTISYPSNIPESVDVDAISLKEVLMNLLGNAIKFTDGGEISLSIGATKIQENKHRINFKVKDTGIGIDNENISKVFEKFVQENTSIRRKFGGSGLGLHLAKHLVSKMGGQLELESQKDVGSTFQFSIDLNSSVKDIATALAPRFSSFGRLCFFNFSEKDRESIANHLEGYSLNVFFTDNLLKIRNDDFVVLTKNSYENNFEFPNEKICILMDLEKVSELKVFSDKILVSSLPFRIWQLLETQETVKSEEPKDQTSLECLVVDDSAENQFILKEMLKEMGHSVTAVSGGEEALEECRKLNFDIIFLDIQMPQMDGYTTIRKLREQKVFTPVFAVTAHETMQERQKIDDAGFSGHIVKPVDFDDFKKVVSIIEPTTQPQSPATLSKTSFPSKVERKIAEMGPKYLSQRRIDLENFDHFLIEENFLEIANIAHKIKGSAKTFGFSKLSEISSEIEKVAQESNLDQCKALVEDFSKELNRVESLQV